MNVSLNFIFNTCKYANFNRKLAKMKIIEKYYSNLCNEKNTAIYVCENL